MLECITNLKRLNPWVWPAIFVTTQIHRRSLPFVAVLLLTGVFIACTGDLPEADQTVAPTSSSVPTTAPSQPSPFSQLIRRSWCDPTRAGTLRRTRPRRRFAELVDGNSAFAFDLYHALRESSDGNLFYSPYSISLALAMTYAGARGETERQMADTLRYLLPQERLHTSFNSLDLELASMADAPEEEGDAFTLNLANAVWGQHDYEFLAPFLDVLTENYGAGVRPTDFVGSPRNRGSGSMTGSLNRPRARSRT